ncbi:hypothetical protein [Streptomyces buecherae]|uniref:hypothetical protein n=1 Tax=Streptomyces buecherae TaxID=2763006 RepID=UPI001E32692E|nr:hypothetical protein [Streptomyces buecherae]
MTTATRRSRTSMSSWRKGRRVAAAVGAVSIGLITLAACDKPTPLATVTVGTSSVNSEATDGCYGDGKVLNEKKTKDCLSKKGGKSIKVAPGEKVRIGVDPEIGESGWVMVSSNPLMKEPSKDNYRSFDGDTLFEQKDPQTGQTVGMRDKVTIAIVELKGNDGPKAMWHFNLERED